MNSTSYSTPDCPLPQTCLPAWDVAELPEAPPLSWRHWTRFIGPGIVMMGIQIGGGEWLVGPEITARYGGGLMWIATIAIIVQVFYNIECGRYALYCGEPIMTGFMRLRPGPTFWIGVVLFLNFAAVIPALSTQAAAVIASLIVDRPPAEADRWLVTLLSYVCLVAVVLPVLAGGKVYNMLQVIMTVKVFVVLIFCLIVGVCFVSAENWFNVFGGFLKFGSVPVSNSPGEETLVNAFQFRWTEGHWPEVAMANIAVLGAFAGYAGGGGLANSTYSNYVRDKGWGMGSRVGAIPSAVGGRHISLSHLGKVFSLTDDNLRRWRRWWRYILTDQICVWAPGCFVGMALPALISIQFAQHSELFHQTNRFEWAQAVISADGMRHAPGLSPAIAKMLWLGVQLVGLIVLLPSQMSIVDDVARRWTDVIWSANQRVRESLHSHQVKYIYYSILTIYVAWTVVAQYVFNRFGTPKLMVLVIANLANLALGCTAFLLLWVNVRLLPKELRPGWINRAGVVCCVLFYLALSGLVFYQKQLPILRELFQGVVK